MASMNSDFNEITQFVSGQKFGDGISSLILDELQGLPVSFRIKLKMIICSYLAGTMPTYQSDVSDYPEMYKIECGYTG